MERTKEAWPFPAREMTAPAGLITVPESSRITTGMLTGCVAEVDVVDGDAGGAAAGVVEGQQIGWALRLSIGTTASWPVGLYRKIANPRQLCDSIWRRSGHAEKRVEVFSLAAFL